MTDQTQQHVVPPLDPTAELQRLSKVADEMTGKLRAHRDMLAQRGMSAPQGALETLQSISKTLQMMVRHSDGGGNAQVELQQLRELARTTEIINSTLDLDPVLDDVIDTVITLTGAERGYIVLKNADTGELEFRVARDVNKQDIPQGEFIVSDTILQRVADQGELLVTVNALEDERVRGAESVANLQLRSILCVPLKRKGEVTGVIYADNRMKPGIFSEREQKLVNAFAHQAAVAIENARLFERVRISLAEITSIRDFMDNVFASIASGVIATDADNRITTLNAAAARILDISRDMAIGQPLMAVLPPLYEGFDRLLADVRERDHKPTLEVEPKMARGQVSLDLKLSPLKNSADETQGVTMVVDDLTALKQQQATLSVVKRYLPPQMVDNIKTIDELELGGVERLVSILQCDVRGFTTFSEQLQPEELMETINEYLTVSSDAIHEQQGVVDKFMGDAVVGLFNTQLNPQEDHALRAVKAGLLMAANVEKLHTKMPETHRLRFGIGVNTGPAVLGNVGSPRRKEFTAIGNSLQLAKLLQENALGGEVLISADTYEIVKDQIIAEKMAPRKFKDHPEFTVMYLVTAVKE